VDDFDAMFARKVVAVAGDINKDDMGLARSDLARVCASVHILIHCAANVDFNERIDGAMTTNCRGPLRMLSIAQRCPLLVAYVHVSTAYVNCNQPSGARVLEQLPVCARHSPPQLQRAYIVLTACLHHHGDAGMTVHLATRSLHPACHSASVRGAGSADA